MDKNAIKKYAVWARNELIARIAQKASKFGVLEKNSVPANADSINGVVLTSVQKKQRQALLTKIGEQGYEQTIEEVAYTWFNRFIALRFMEVNGYLPSHVRVFTDSENNFKPEIMSEAINMDLNGIDIEHIYSLKEANMDEELFRYMLILQCNALNKILPVMFQKLEDYTELLLPDNLLREGSVVYNLIDWIPEDNWQDQVQIIGWLYQYYNTEPKDKVFANLKKNIKISKENIPAATQLFTPDWIVRYMVENSLGRLWVEGHPNDELKSNWKYYLEEAEQEPEVQAQLTEIRKEYAQLQPEDLLCIDPCQGSGHILCYMFDVLMQIYEAYGYTSREAVKNIVEKNIWGLDIDERASQLAYFSVMMKARQYDRRFFSHIAQPNVFAIEESNGIDKDLLQYFGYGMDELSKNVAKTQLAGLLEQMHDAKEYGSIINVDACDWNLLKEFVSEYDAGEAGLFNVANLYEVQVRLHKLISVAQALGQKYYTVVTNPPYMGASGMVSKLQEYLKFHYVDSKSDLYAVFIEKTSNLTIKNGFRAMITQHSWMFLNSYEKLRVKILHNNLVNMAHLGTRAFDDIAGEVVQTTTFVLRNTLLSKYKGLFVRLLDGKNQEEKEQSFRLEINRYVSNSEQFKNVPGYILAYWNSKEFLKAFNYAALTSFAIPKQGIATANNNYYTRLWFECAYNNIYFNCDSHNASKNSTKKWYPYNKGGEFRKWYGNDEYVINWRFDGEALKNDKKAVLRNPDFYFKKCITWSLISMGATGFRYKDTGFLFDVAGMSFFSNDYMLYLCGFCNSIVAYEYLKVLAPTINFQVGDIAKLPIIVCDEKKHIIEQLVQECIDLSKEEWDSFETSWSFKKHPLV